MPHRSPVTRGLSFALASAMIAAALVFSTRRAPSAPDRPAPDEPPQLPLRDWPMFGGTPQRNLANPIAKNLPAEWSVEAGNQKNIKWIANLGSKAYGGPVIAGGRIFVGTNNKAPRDKKWDFVDPKTGRLIDLAVLMCFRESDGKFLWQAVHEKLPGGQVVDWPLEGLVSTPVVEGDRLYYVSNRCEVVCANVADGNPIWKLDMIGDLGVFPHNMSSCCPLIVGDLVMVITSNGVNEDHLQIPAPHAPSFVAVNKRTGKVAWADNSPTAKVPANANAAVLRDLMNRGDILLHGQWSNPALGFVHGKAQVVFPGGDGWLYAFTPEGKLIWKFDANPKDAKFALKTGERSDFIGTPVIYKDRVYVGVGQDPEHKTGVGHFWCIDMTKTGDVSDEVRLGNNIVKKNPNSAVLWHFGGLITDKDLQKKLRRYYHFGRTMSTCAIHDSLLYITDVDATVFCLDADNGKVQWRHDTRSEIWASPFYADGKVYIGTDDRTVWVFQHGRQKKLLGENEVDGRIRRPVAANNGVLYILTENQLIAVASQK